MSDERKRRLARAARAALRYPWAATLIPVGLLLGVGGLVQHTVRTIRPRRGKGDCRCRCD